MDTVNRCSSCRVERKGMSRCSRCKSVYYCGTECQKSNWKYHKMVCRPKETSPSQHQETSDDDSSTSVIEQMKKLGFYLPKPEVPPEPARWVENELMSFCGLIQSNPPANFFRPVDSASFGITCYFKDVPMESDLQSNTVLLAKIIEPDGYKRRHGIRIADEDNKSLIVYFHITGTPGPFFQWTDLQPGHFICIQDPAIHLFIDGQRGFRVDNASSVRILSNNRESMTVEQ